MWILLPQRAGVTLLCEPRTVEAWIYHMIGVKQSCCGLCTARDAIALPHLQMCSCEGHYLCSPTEVTDRGNPVLFAMAEPLSQWAFEQLPTVHCPVTLACGGGGLPTDNLQGLRAANCIKAAPKQSAQVRPVSVLCASPLLPSDARATPQEAGVQ